MFLPNKSVPFFRKGEIRELVISYGKHGYVALYRFLPERSLIRILALRYQRELDYAD